MIKIIGWAFALYSIGMGIYGLWAVYSDSYDKLVIKDHRGQIADIKYEYYHDGGSKTITSSVFHLTGEDLAYKIHLGGANGTLNDNHLIQAVSTLKKGDQVQFQYRSGYSKKKKIVISIGFPDQAPLISAEETKARSNNRTNHGSYGLIIIGLIMVYFLIKK